MARLSMETGSARGDRRSDQRHPAYEPRTHGRINLAPPPVVDPSTGKAAEPVPEKSFLQKYWLPLLGVAFFVLSQVGPDPPRQGGGEAAAS
jgi:hypothetical protein